MPLDLVSLSQVVVHLSLFVLIPDATTCVCAVLISAVNIYFSNESVNLSRFSPSIRFSTQLLCGLPSILLEMLFGFSDPRLVFPSKIVFCLGRCSSAFSGRGWGSRLVVSSIVHVDNIFILDAVRGDSNDGCCNSSLCSELASNAKPIEGSATDTGESAMECGSSVDGSRNAAVTALPEPSTGNIDFAVICNKQKIGVSFALDGTVAELGTHLQKIVSVPQAVQRVVFEGLAKDDQTLGGLGVTKGARVMMVGSGLDDVLAVSIPARRDLIDEAVSSVSGEPLSQQKVHRRVLDGGIPEDVMPGMLDGKEPLPEFPLAGVLNGSGGGVRLAFRLGQDQLWIGAGEGTDKVPMNSMGGVHGEPIHDHPEYHIVAIQLGTTEASRCWICWVPAQCVSAIRDAILGRWCCF